VTAAAGAAAAGAMAAMMNAVRAMGTLVEVEAEVFVDLVKRESPRLIVHAPTGFFVKKQRYLAGMAGLAFYTNSQKELNFDARVPVVSARKIWIPG
jgi:hypothetical protein